MPYQWRHRLRHKTQKDALMYLATHPHQPCSFYETTVELKKDTWHLLERMGDVLFTMTADRDVQVGMQIKRMTCLFNDPFFSLDNKWLTDEHKIYLKGGRHALPFKDLAYIQLIACNYTNFYMSVDQDCKLTLLYGLLQTEPRRLLAFSRSSFYWPSTRDKAAQVIQEAWRACVSNPYHPIGKRRLVYEFEVLVKDT